MPFQLCGGNEESSVCAGVAEEEVQMLKTAEAAAAAVDFDFLVRVERAAGSVFRPVEEGLLCVGAVLAVSA